jgi:hypothetical protein
VILHVKEAKYLHDYVIWVRFNDGAEGEVDLEGELEGEVFEPLNNPSLFKALRVDPILQTVVWPNEADLAPEFLYDKMKVSACIDRVRAGKFRVLAVSEGSGTYLAGQPGKSRAGHTTIQNLHVKAWGTKKDKMNRPAAARTGRKKPRQNTQSP